MVRSYPSAQLLRVKRWLNVSSSVQRMVGKSILSQIWEIVNLRLANGKLRMMNIIDMGCTMIGYFRLLWPNGSLCTLSDAARHYPARFMLYVVDVHDAKKDAIPAVTQVDGTARLQTVREDTAPRYHRLIERFGKATGVPVLPYTSFNLKGEPIVNTPAEALATFGRSGMDVRVFGDSVVEKRASGGSEP